MKRTLVIAALISVVLGVCFFVRTQMALHQAKIQAERESSISKEMLNKIPAIDARIIKPALVYTNEVSISRTGFVISLPAETFSRDANPKRADTLLHHAKYRVMIFDGIKAGDFEPAMSLVEQTNLNRFVLSAFNATERDISKQKSLKRLYKHLALLQSKALLAPVGFEDSCIRFERGDATGFVIGDPNRGKTIYVMFYVERPPQFVQLGIIATAPLQMQDIEELISALQVRPN